jgi:tRNA 2-selenouridine synthase
MNQAPVIVVEMIKKLRIKRLVKEYSLFNPQYLEQSIMKIQKRLGGLNTQNCIKAVREKKFAKAIDISLTYYDKTYLYGLEKKKKRICGHIRAEDNSLAITARNIIAVSLHGHQLL